MADEKKGTGPERPVVPESPAPESPGGPPVPEQAAEQGVIPGMGDGPAQPEPGDVVVDFEKINELMAEKRAAARDAVEHEEAPAPEAETPADGPSVPKPPDKGAAPDDREPWEKTSAELEAEQKKPRRGRPPKEEKAEQGASDTAKPRKGRPAKADKAAPGEAPPSQRDKVSRGKKAAPVKAEPKAPAPEPAREEPKAPPRPVEDQKIVYLKLSELHAFHTFRAHPFQVKDDDRMTELVGTIKEHGVMTPATVRPEKDGNGYEIVAGHRRQRGSELAGLEEMPCIVRDMTDIEAVLEMRNSNKQRGDPLPSELAKLLDLEVEAIKHQGGRLDGVAAGDVGKRSVEIVGAEHGMNYKKVMRYIRLNSLVPELLNMADEKKLGFMPAVEISYIKPKNQRLIAVSIDGEQSSPSLAQAKKMRELDKEGKLTGDVIDGILSEKKKEDRGVIISTAELEKYFGKEVLPGQMKEQIMALLDDWKAKQPPERTAPEKKAAIEK
jgi:ParB family transcriptional regulator, chromosome partitioning protein